MPRSLATSTMIPGALLLALACAACNRPPPPPPDQPPEPQASTQLGDAIQAPIERAKAVEGAVQDAAEKQKGALDAAAGGRRRPRVPRRSALVADRIPRPRLARPSAPLRGFEITPG